MEQMSGTKHKYTENNPIFKILLVLPFFFSLLSVVLPWVMRYVGARLIFPIVTIISSVCLLVLPWAIPKYLKDKQAYRFNASLSGCFVCGIIGTITSIATLIGISTQNILIWMLFGWISFATLLATMVTGIVFWNHNQKSYIINAKTAQKLMNDNKFGGISNRKWVTTLLLFIFLGIVGAHRFYVGKRTYGTITLVLTILLIGIIIFIIPNIVDFVKILSHTYKDNWGRIITDLK